MKLFGKMIFRVVHEIDFLTIHTRFRSIAENQMKKEGGSWLGYLTPWSWLDTTAKEQEEFYQVIDYDVNQAISAEQDVI